MTAQPVPAPRAGGGGGGGGGSSTEPLPALRPHQLQGRPAALSRAALLLVQAGCPHTSVHTSVGLRVTVQRWGQHALRELWALPTAEA